MSLASGIAHFVRDFADRVKLRALRGVPMITTLEIDFAVILVARL
jgi:hypothetical protein